jgi:hypothetical protein
MILTLVSTMMDGEVTVDITRLHMINNNAAAPIDNIRPLEKNSSSYFVQLFTYNGLVFGGIYLGDLASKITLETQAVSILFADGFDWLKIIARHNSDSRKHFGSQSRWAK